MQRMQIAELLDTDSGSPAEVAASLGDLRRINRWFGGVGTTQAMVERVAEKSEASTLSLLEVAGGSGYVPETVRQIMSSKLQLEVTVLDRAASHLKNGSQPKRAVVGDALGLPFADNSFDLVHSALFAHHLPPDELVRAVNESLRVCRVAVLINDLIRHPFHLALVYAGMPLYRSRITRHDAPASVRQAYTLSEIREVLSKTAAREIEIQRHYLFRMGVIIWKRSS